MDSYTATTILLVKYSDLNEIDSETLRTEKSMISPVCFSVYIDSSRNAERIRSFECRGQENCKNDRWRPVIVLMIENLTKTEHEKINRKFMDTKRIDFWGKWRSTKITVDKEIWIDGCRRCWISFFFFVFYMMCMKSRRSRSISQFWRIVSNE